LGRGWRDGITASKRRRDGREQQSNGARDVLCLVLARHRSSTRQQQNFGHRFPSSPTEHDHIAHIGGAVQKQALPPLEISSSSSTQTIYSNHRQLPLSLPIIHSAGGSEYNMVEIANKPICKTVVTRCISMMRGRPDDGT
jgi:hypothetical protein